MEVYYSEVKWYNINLKEDCDKDIYYKHYSNHK